MAEPKPGQGGQASFDAIYVSPHLDDVALSAAGQIGRRVSRGERVLIVTLFAGDEPAQAVLSPLAAGFHRRLGRQRRVVQMRRLEDRAAWELLGACHRHQEWPEAVYRIGAGGGRALYPSLRSLFGRPAPEEPLGRSLRECLERLPRCPRLFAPLGVGGHVDHVLAAEAARQAIPADRLHFYEEFLYVEADGAVEAALAATGGRWASEVLTLEPGELRLRLDASACYHSQIGPLFGSRPSMEERTSAQLRRTGGERVWRRVYS